MMFVASIDSSKTLIFNALQTFIETDIVRYLDFRYSSVVSIVNLDGMINCKGVGPLSSLMCFCISGSSRASNSGCLSRYSTDS